MSSRRAIRHRLRSLIRSGLLALVGLGSVGVAAEPVTVRLHDAISDGPLAAQEVTVYERLSGGNLRWHARVGTDMQGRASLDLAGLGSGRSYVLRSSPYGTTVTSAPVTAAGVFDFPVGSVALRALSGVDDSPLVGWVLRLKRRTATGASHDVVTVVTDHQGYVRIDPPDLGAGESWYVRADSPIDGMQKESAPFATRGVHALRIGGRGVMVSLENALSRVRLPGQAITILEEGGAGNLTAVRTVGTDANGQVHLDLDGLGQGRVYRLRATPYGETVTSARIASTGSFDFRVGTFELQLTDGATGDPMPGALVSVLRVASDGAAESLGTFVADVNARVRLDPPPLSAGEAWQLSAVSPVDGTRKTSHPITSLGAHVFPVGNPPVIARVVDSVSGERMANLELRVVEVLPDDQTTLRYRGDTDANGEVVVDLDGLDAARRYRLLASPHGKTIESELITRTGVFEFPVGKLRLDLVNGSDGSAHASQPVHLRLREADGTLTYLRALTTDANGRVYVDPQPLRSGQSWLVSGNGSIDGLRKDADPITDFGAHTVTIGNAPLVARLVNAFSGAALGNQDLTVWERTSAVDTVRRRSVTTNTDGTVVLDLEGLGDGRVYELRADPFGRSVTSLPITDTGVFEFPLGNLRMTLVSGADGTHLGNWSLTLLRQLPDGSLAHVSGHTTTAAGWVQTDPAPLGVGETYVVRADSAVDGSTKLSEPFSGLGSRNVEIGNLPLTLSLRDAGSNLPLAGVTVDVQELLPSGERRLERRVDTDASGRITVDLDGLGNGVVYVAKAAPYGRPVVSDPIEAPGEVPLLYGTVPVILTDLDAGLPLADRRLVAFKKHADGSLEFEGTLQTGTDGIARFDLEDLDTGGVYVFRAEDPFGDGEDFYSRYVLREGPVVFAISATEDSRLDRQTPQVSIVAPTRLQVSERGFSLNGYAVDNHTVTSVAVVVFDPGTGTHELGASYDPSSQEWSAYVPGNVLTAGHDVQIRVIATDDSYNEGTASQSYAAITDADAPQVTITSPMPLAEVPLLGFQVSGQVNDATRIKRLAIDVVAGAKRTTITAPTADDGRWTATVGRGALRGASSAAITVIATDSHDNDGSASITVSLAGNDTLARRVIDRATFGVTAELLAEVEGMGAMEYIEQQLDPGSIDDSHFEQTHLGAVPTTRVELQEHAMLRAVHSKRQLEALMGQFWDNHFNTYFSSHGQVVYEYDEHEAFRQHAFGRFRDLLGISAKSPAMLSYLDLKRSRWQAPNENYPRELVELHAMGVDGGYTQEDINELARAFTGWRVIDGQFAFEAGWHDFDEKVVLGVTLPAGQGIEDGEQVLDILAAHPSTATHICTKLVEHFVDDQPPARLVDACAATYLDVEAEPDQMAQVLRTIFYSPEFAAAEHWGSKFKTPLEYVAGAARVTGYLGSVSKLRAALSTLEMPLFENPVPTGYAEVGTAWIDPNQLLQRLAFGADIVDKPYHFDPTTLVDGTLPETPHAIIAHLYDLLVGEQPVWAQWSAVNDALTVNRTRTFSYQAPDLDQRLRQAVAVILGSPGYSLQ